MQNKEIIDRRYEIITTLASKRKHQVFLARHINLNTLWIIKKSTKENNDLLVGEMNILKRLNHSSIPRVVDFFKCGENTLLVEDYFEGTILKEIIENNCGTINENKAVQWLREIAKIINYLHCFKPYPIIYGDLKPSNIIVTPEKSIKLIDFESARIKGDHALQCLGTIGYAAPEQFYGNMNERTDVYSFGVVMYYMMTGCKRLPKLTIENDNVISDKMWHIIDKCTQNNPQKRYQNMKEILMDMNA